MINILSKKPIFIGVLTICTSLILSACSSGGGSDDQEVNGIPKQCSEYCDQGCAKISDCKSYTDAQANECETQCDAIIKAVLDGDFDNENRTPATKESLSSDCSDGKNKIGDVSCSEISNGSLNDGVTKSAVQLSEAAKLANAGEDGRSLGLMEK